VSLFDVLMPFPSMQVVASDKSIQLSLNTTALRATSADGVTLLTREESELCQDPWILSTGWIFYLTEAEDNQTIVEPPLFTSTVQAKYDEVHDALDHVLDRCRSGIRPSKCPVRYSQMLIDRSSAIGPYKPNPLNLYATDGIHANHKRMWHGFLEYTLKSHRTRTLNPAVSDKISRTLLCETDPDQMEKLVLDFLIGVVEGKVGFKRFSNPLMSFLAMLSITEDEKTLAGPHRCIEHLRSIVDVALALILEHVHPAASRETNPCSPGQFGQYVVFILAVGAPSAIAETYNLLTLASNLIDGDERPGAPGAGVPSAQRKRPRLDIIQTGLSSMSGKASMRGTNKETITSRSTNGTIRKPNLSFKTSSTRETAQIINSNRSLNNHPQPTAPAIDFFRDTFRKFKKDNPDPICPLCWLIKDPAQTHHTFYSCRETDINHKCVKYFRRKFINWEPDCQIHYGCGAPNFVCGMREGTCTWTDILLSMIILAIHTEKFDPITRDSFKPIKNPVKSIEFIFDQLPLPSSIQGHVTTRAARYLYEIMVERTQELTLINDSLHQEEVGEASSSSE